MSEISVSIEAPERAAATVPDSRFDAVIPGFKGNDHSVPNDLRFLSPSIRTSQPSRASRVALLSYYDEVGYNFVKRVLDIVISLFSLTVLSPVLLYASLAVKVHDGGPVLFAQTRVGRNGRLFRCFKFRSMVVNAEALQLSLMEDNDHSDQRTFKIMNDPRITRPGRLLRRLSIDELPQLFNVLRGDMTIVGPRPPLPSEVALYSEYDYQRLLVKPGLTCIWQVSGRSRLPFSSQVKMDLEYIRKRSVLTDIAIILRTVPAVLTGDGAA